MKTLQVVAGIFEQNGKILICRRKEGKSLAGFWEFPGGKIEASEDPESALIRELKEELNVEVEIVGFFMENIHQYPDFNIRILAYWVATKDEVKISTDHDLLQWISPLEYEHFNWAAADLPIVISILK